MKGGSSLVGGNGVGERGDGGTNPIQWIMHVDGSVAELADHRPASVPEALLDLAFAEPAGQRLVPT